jgi:hypothetical protein
MFMNNYWQRMLDYIRCLKCVCVYKCIHMVMIFCHWFYH